MNDSLATYGKGLIETAPSLFYGYILLGTYHKNLGDFSSANKYYELSASYVKNSNMYTSPEKTLQYIRELKSSNN